MFHPRNKKCTLHINSTTPLRLLGRPCANAAFHPRLFFHEYNERIVDICYDYVLDASARGHDWLSVLSGVEPTLRSHVSPSIHGCRKCLAGRYPVNLCEAGYLCKRVRHEIYAPFNGWVHIAQFFWCVDYGFDVDICLSADGHLYSIIPLMCSLNHPKPQTTFIILVQHLAIRGSTTIHCAVV